MSASELRPLFPAVVARVARRERRRSTSEELAGDAGVMGPGGRADWDAYGSDARRSRPLR